MPAYASRDDHRPPGVWLCARELNPGRRPVVQVNSVTVQVGTPLDPGRSATSCPPSCSSRFSSSCADGFRATVTMRGLGVQLFFVARVLAEVGSTSFGPWPSLRKHSLKRFVAGHLGVAEMAENRWSARGCFFGSGMLPQWEVAAPAQVAVGRRATATSHRRASGRRSCHLGRTCSAGCGPASSRSHCGVAHLVVLFDGVGSQALRPGPSHRPAEKAVANGENDQGVVEQAASWCLRRRTEDWLSSAAGRSGALSQVPTAPSFSSSFSRRALRAVACLPPDRL